MADKIKSPDVRGLSSIQTEFDIYQSKAFGSRSSSFFCLELCGEAGELANLEKKMWRNPSHSFSKDELGSEAADVFIALFNYCNSRKIDIEQAVAKKLGIIEERRLRGEMGPSNLVES
ncbi:MAG: hypothetical protein K2X39_09900 [Silvanigrellaceae bacterium]|nr:hypothetical protein [Silvanigrellaceae bacterium]